MMGIKLKEAMDKLGVKCHVEYSGGPKNGDYENMVEFSKKTRGRESIRMRTAG